MPSKPVETTFQDILDHIALAERFVGDLDWPKLHDDTRTFYAVVRCLEIISEASRRLPAEFKDRYAWIPWSRIAAAGNVYRHDYDEVETRIVWDTVKGALPELRAVVESELKAMPKKS
jgi:uncharacterized protein with HEPN domain